jgi:hypothetical protein
MSDLNCGIIRRGTGIVSAIALSGSSRRSHVRSRHWRGRGSQANSLPAALKSLVYRSPWQLSPLPAACRLRSRHVNKRRWATYQSAKLRLERHRMERYRMPRRLRRSSPGPKMSLKAWSCIRHLAGLKTCFAGFERISPKPSLFCRGERQ